MLSVHALPMQIEMVGKSPVVFYGPVQIKSYRNSGNDLVLTDVVQRHKNQKAGV